MRGYKQGRERRAAVDGSALPRSDYEHVREEDVALAADPARPV